MLASACCFGAIPIFTIVATADVPLQTFLVGRYFLATLILAPLVATGLRHVPRARLLPLLAIGGIGQSLITWLGLTALEHVPAATAGFLFYTYPAWITVIAAARGSEPLSARRVAALALALTGVALMVGTPWSGALNATGVILALSAAVVYALYVPAIRQAQGDVRPEVAAFCISIAAGAIYLLLGAATGSLTPELTPRVTLAIGGTALISTVSGFLLFLRGLAALGAVRTGIISTIEPFFTALLAWLLLGQSLTILTIAGGALIAIAVVVLTRESVSAGPTRSRTPPAASASSADHP